MPSDPPDASESTSNRYLKNNNFQNVEAPGGALGSAPGARLVWRLGPATGYEYDKVVKCHCTVDTIVRDDCYACPMVPPGRRKHCTALYRPLRALYTKRQDLNKMLMYLNRGRSDGPDMTLYCRDLQV